MSSQNRRSVDMNHRIELEEPHRGDALTTAQDQTAHDEATEPQKPWYKRWWAIALGIFLVLGLIGSFFADDEEDEEPDEAEQAEEQSGENAEASEEEDTSEDEEAAEEEPETVEYTITLEEAFGDNGEVRIEFDLPDHFTAGLMASSAQRTAAEGLEDARAEYPDADRYYVWINGEDGPASNAAFEPETLDSLDLSDRTLNVFEHLDAGSAHPELLD